MKDHLCACGPPQLSVIIPVLNESGRIEAALDHLFNLSFNGRMEVAVVDGSPRGDTLSAVRRHPVIRILSPPGRGRQMNRGAAETRGDILLFLHADTRLPACGLNAACHALRDARLSGGAFDLTIDSPNPAFRVIERAASLRSRITRIPYGDQAIFLRRSCFRILRGFRGIPIMEDVDLMRRIRKKGMRITLLSPPVTTASRRWEREGIVIGTLRNRMLMALFQMGAPPERLLRFYPPP